MVECLGHFPPTAFIAANSSFSCRTWAGEKDTRRPCDDVVMIIVKVIAMFILMMIKMLTAKQTTIVTVTAFDTAMMIQTVME